MTRHRSHIGLTDARTFNEPHLPGNRVRLKSDPGQTKRARSAVSGHENTRSRAARSELHGSKTVSAGFGVTVRILGPFSVTATVCSKCAESEPSSVEIDHSSSCKYTSGPPALIIGSIANVIPGWSSGPRPAGP